MSFTRTPKWHKWLNIPDVMLWEAVALSLNIDPEKVKHAPSRWEFSGMYFEEDEVFDDRVVVAKRNLSASNGGLVPPALETVPTTETSDVSLKAFAA
jgi:hypothetical protein